MFSPREEMYHLSNSIKYFLCRAEDVLIFKLAVIEVFTYCCYTSSFEMCLGEELRKCIFLFRLQYMK